MPATQSSVESTQRPRPLPGVSMRDLLAACAAAAAVSTPPRAPERPSAGRVRDHREAA
ncbi:hypothetical protein AB0G55_01535 [Streptomyces toyocaensis]|uniref:hypothetical protein n=1 Tax=Streptomyces toyocaensis TaxID=55952 RepID=UPI000B28BF3F|nr:hypothetical protein [Streptomyces toyocaensis]